MKKHFLLIFTALLMGFSALDSFAVISYSPSIPTPPTPLGHVNMKIEPVYFTNTPTLNPPAFYSWGIKTPGTLPPGLTLNQVGVLSGVPTKEGNYTFIVVCTQKNPTISVPPTLTLTVKIEKKPFPAITTTSPLPPGQMDVPYVQGAGGVNFKATGGVPFLPTPDKPTGYNWALSWGKIPTGMTFNTVGALSGIPVLDRKLSGNFTQPQTFTFNITATDAVLGNNTKTFSLTINPPVPPTIITDCPLPDGLELYPYANVYLKATSGKKEYKWSVGPSTNLPLPQGAFNRFPDGLILSPDGTIYSKPTLPGLFVFRLKVTDANGLTAEKECRITIIPAPIICTEKLFECVSVGDDAGCFPMCAKGGGLPYTWTATGLPPALTINSTTGKICGNFTQAGNFTANITVRESFKGNTANKSFPIVVKPKLEITTISPLPWGIVGRSYPGNASLSPVKIEAKGGWLPYTMWKVVLGKLPDGLTLDPDSGIIGGTPILKGSYKFTVQVIDGCGKVAFKEFIIDIYDPITLPTPPIPCLTVNKPFSTTLTASGGLAPLSWQLLSSSSPAYQIAPGAGNTATLSGTPSQAGSVSLSIRITDANNESKDFTLTYNALQEVKITSDCPPSEWTSGKPITPVTLTAIGGSGIYTWIKYNAIAKPWPSWLDIVGNKIQGTPLVSSTTNYTIAYQVQDSCGNTDTKNCTITIYPALSCNQTLNLPCLYNGMNLTETVALQGIGGKPPYVDWTLSPIGSGKMLPNGLLQKKPPVGAGNGSTFYGNITENGTFQFNATVTDSLGNTCTRNHTIVVHPKLVITTPSPLPVAYIGLNYSTTINATGGKPCYTWTLNSTSINPQDFGNLQIGNLNCNSSILTGVPKKVGNYTLTVTAADACGQSVDQIYTIEVKENAILSCLKEIWIVVDYPASGNYIGHNCNDAEFPIFIDTTQVMLASLNNQGNTPIPSFCNPTSTAQGYCNTVSPCSEQKIDYAGVAPGSRPSTFIFPHPETNNSTARYNRVLISGQKLQEIANATSGSVVKVTAKCGYCGQNKGGKGCHNDAARLRVYTNKNEVGDFAQATLIKELTIQKDIPVIVDLCEIITGNATNSAQVISTANLELLNSPNLPNLAGQLSMALVQAGTISSSLQSLPLLQINSFRISKHEITNQQYADFLNASAQSDPNQLYNPLMGNVGIQRRSTNGVHIYTVDSGLEDYPVTYVSWFDAARYANWLANGKPNGPQGPATTEDGTYSLGVTPTGRNKINPNTGAPPVFWLLNESEWYTSAYLKADGSAMWIYPTQSNAAPDANGSNPANLANFGSAFDGATPVGFFDRSPGPFGTFDQAGNVREWTETLDTSSGKPMIIIRGGSWADPVDAMRSDESQVADPTLEDDKTSFRIGGAP